MAVIETILLQAMLSFLMLGSVAGLIAGTILILRPHWLVRASLITNRWVSTRHIDKLLESTINIDPWYYRYPRTSGLVTLAGAIYILYFFSARIDKTSTISALSQQFQVPAAYINALFDPLVLIAILGSAFALFVSLFVLLQPSLFRKFEQASNEWVSLRRTIKPLEISRNSVDEFTFRHTQQMGVILLLGSVYTLVLLTFWAK